MFDPKIREFLQNRVIRKDAAGGYDAEDALDAIIQLSRLYTEAIEENRKSYEEALTQNNKAHDVELAELRTIISEQEREIKDLKTASAELEKQNEDYTAAIRQYEQTVFDYEDRLAEAERALALAPEPEEEAFDNLFSRIEDRLRGDEPAEEEPLPTIHSIEEAWEAREKTVTEAGAGPAEEVPAGEAPPEEAPPEIPEILPEKISLTDAKLDEMMEKINFMNSRMEEMIDHYLREKAALEANRRDFCELLKKTIEIIEGE